MLNQQELHERVLYPVTRVRSTKAGGSGVLVYSQPDPKKDGKFINILLSCEHVISDSVVVKEDWDPVLKQERKKDFFEEVQVEVFDYDGSKIVSANATAGDIIAYDKHHDIAAIKLHNTRQMPFVASIIPKDEIDGLKLFDPVYTSGASLLHEPFATPGQITYLREIIEQKEFVMSSCSAVFGNSGGGLFHGMSGNLIGLVSRVTTIQLGFGVDVMCYDPDTEVLTADGWKPFPTVTKSDSLATRSETGELEYHPPTFLVEKDFSGDLLHFKNTKIDILVTPNHNMLVSRQERCGNGKHKVSEPRFIRADEMHGPSWLFHSGATWNCEAPAFIEIPTYFREWQSGRRNTVSRVHVVAKRPINTKIWLEFLGYYIAEGCIMYQRGIPVSIRLTQSYDSPLLEKMLSVVRHMGFSASIYEKKGSNCADININDVGLALHLERYGRGARNKHLTKDEKSLTPDLLEILLQAMMKGDGHVRNRSNKNGTGSTCSAYITSSEQLAGDVQELCLKTGRTGYIKKYNLKGSRFSIHPTYQVTLGKFVHHWFDARKIKKVPYSGKVYCAIVPNHTLFVRRNGHAVWCGNTWMNFSSHPNRLYEFFKDQELQFLYDPKDNYYDAMARRERRRKDALKSILLGDAEAGKAAGLNA